MLDGVAALLDGVAALLDGVAALLDGVAALLDDAGSVSAGEANHYSIVLKLSLYSALLVLEQ